MFIDPCGSRRQTRLREGFSRCFRGLKGASRFPCGTSAVAGYAQDSLAANTAVGASARRGGPRPACGWRAVSRARLLGLRRG